jgi:hypothetical protein
MRDRMEVICKVGIVDYSVSNECGGGGGWRERKGEERRERRRKEERIKEVRRKKVRSEKGKWDKRGVSKLIFGQNGRGR